MSNRNKNETIVLCSLINLFYGWIIVKWLNLIYAACDIAYMTRFMCENGIWKLNEVWYIYSFI